MKTDLEIKPGIYKHYKGNYYRVHRVAVFTEDKTESFVIYQALSGECGTWARPAKMWNEMVEVGGKINKRFEPFIVESSKFVDKVALVYIRDGKILFTRSAGIDGFYYSPGGKRDLGETDLECLAREIKEELSVNIKPDTAQFYGVFYGQAHGKSEGMLLRMACYQCDFDGEPVASEEIEELAWLSYRDRDRVPPAGKCFLDELYSKGLLVY